MHRPTTVTTLKPRRARFRIGATDLLSVADLSPADTMQVLDLARQIKVYPQDFVRTLEGRHLVLMFEKPSLRTRLTFEAGITAMGGHATFVDHRDSRIDARESLADIAHNLDRWMSGIVLRTFDHATVTGMAMHSRVPVINALSDLEHPCQALADYLTLLERFGDLRAVRLAYIGDGNNVAHSLLFAAAQMGSTIAVATPPGFEPTAEVVARARVIAAATGAQIAITHDVIAAVSGANAVYTDVWASMGQEAEAEARRTPFLPYQVNAALMSRAAPNAVFMHCLPAHRGDEVTDDVMDSPVSVVFDAAENRLHVQKAILALLAGNEVSRV